MYTLEEQADNRQKWIDALQSGEYPQTGGALRDEIGFCCLGVACDVSGLGEWQRTKRRNSASYGYSYQVNEESEAGALPNAVREWLGLRLADGEYTTRLGKSATLAELNDMYGGTFDSIADFIETEPDGLIAKSRT